MDLSIKTIIARANADSMCTCTCTCTVECQVVECQAHVELRSAIAEESALLADPEAMYQAWMQHCQQQEQEICSPLPLLEDTEVPAPEPAKYNYNYNGGTYEGDYDNDYDDWDD